MTPSKYLQPSLAGLCLLGPALVLGLLMKYSHYGFDFTDESFYLVWMSNPFIYPASITQFGFVYHPLYRLLDGDIATLRQANILIVYLLAWLLSFAYLNSLATNARGSRLTLAAISAGLAVCALTYFDLWLATPSYNSLAFQALLITALGLLLCEKEASRTSISGWLLVSVGGWLAFMAKPSTAAALALCALAYLLIARKLSMRMMVLVIAFTATLLLWSALAIDGSILGFVKRLKLGMESARLMDGGYKLTQLIRLDRFDVNAKFTGVFILIGGLLALAIACMAVRTKKAMIVGAALNMLFLIATSLLVVKGTHQAIDLGPFQNLLIFALSFSSALITVLLGKLKGIRNIPLPQWALAALFITMPHIYAFGTNNNYWLQAGATAFFWMLSGLVLASHLARHRSSTLVLLPLSFMAPAVTALLLQKAIDAPYRQPETLRQMDSVTQIGPSGSGLLVSAGFATYIRNAQATAQRGAFQPGTPIIDLTGQSPGILFSLGAESIGQAWMIGGYPGSLKLAEFALMQASCEKVASAWLLHEPDGPRSVSTSLMSKFGANFPSDYKRIGNWQTASGAGGYPSPRLQDLYQPINFDKSLATCKTIQAQHTK